MFRKSVRVMARIVIIILLFQFVLGVLPGRGVEAVNSLDQDLFRAINSGWKSPAMDEIMRVSTYMGDGFFVMGVLGGLYLYGQQTGNEKYIETAQVGFNALARAGLLAQAGKYIFQRPRPGLVLDDVNFNGPVIADRRSFPSGHTTAAFSLATVLAEEFPDYKKYFYTGAWMVGLSRIYNGVHFPTDVLAGALLGHLIGKRSFGQRLQINQDGFLVYMFSF
ncbi:MAG: phosphatase PAP2 family protein [Halanaerobium sp.]|nr:phosphatase PAP2 family protein [Halanaerobium sp.]